MKIRLRKATIGEDVARLPALRDAIGPDIIQFVYCRV